MSEKGKKVVIFNKKSIKNPQRDTCENLFLELQNFVNDSNIDMSEYITSRKSSISKKKDNITKVEFVKKFNIDNENDLLEFYKQNKGEKGKLPAKKVIAELTNISQSTIFRYTKILKDKGLIKTKGNSNYLIEGE